MSIFHREPGVIHPPLRPKLPIPEIQDPTAEEERPRDGGLLLPEKPPFSPPAYMGETFGHLCRFWTILHDIPSHYYEREDGSEKEVPIAFAEYKYRELLAWSNSLPQYLVRDEHSPHHVMIMQ